MKVRYFAWLRQRTGVAEEEVEPPAHVRTVGELARWLGERHPRFGEVLAAGGAVRFAVNQEYADPDTPVKADDEVAFFPPVTGG
ncbi:Molybdopterin synthase sulfur carrier subunit [bacterium HR39]|nr:Molybdopterin synthase sulfur carrier subunit [bacterium HR39]